MGKRAVIDLSKLEALAARGLNYEQLGRALGYTGRALFRWRKRADVQEAIDKGRAKGAAQVANKLFDLATKENNLGAIIFYLKARCGWREETKLDLTSSDKSMSPKDDGVKLDLTKYTPEQAADLVRAAFGKG